MRKSGAARGRGEVGVGAISRMWREVGEVIARRPGAGRRVVGGVGVGGSGRAVGGRVGGRGRRWRVVVFSFSRVWEIGVSVVWRRARRLGEIRARAEGVRVEESGGIEAESVERLARRASIVLVMLGRANGTESGGC